MSVSWLIVLFSLPLHATSVLFLNEGLSDQKARQIDCQTLGILPSQCDHLNTEERKTFNELLKTKQAMLKAIGSYDQFRSSKNPYITAIGAQLQMPIFFYVSSKSEEGRQICVYLKDKKMDCAVEEKEILANMSEEELLVISEQLIEKLNLLLRQQQAMSTIYTQLVDENITTILTAILSTQSIAQNVSSFTLTIVGSGANGKKALEYEWQAVTPKNAANTAAFLNEQSRPFYRLTLVKRVLLSENE